MTQVLVGVFGSFEQADQAVASLVRAGIARSEMEVHSTERGSKEPVMDLGAGQPAKREDERVGGKIAHFFSNLFGSDAQPAEVGHYQEAVRRGGAILTVTVLDESKSGRPDSNCGRPQNGIRSGAGDC